MDFLSFENFLGVGQQGYLMGDQGWRAARELLWISDPIFNLSCGLLPGRGNPCAFQEHFANGEDIHFLCVCN